MKPISQRRTYLQLPPEEETDLRAFSSSNGILPQQGDCFLNAPAANTFLAAAGLGVSDVRLGPALPGSGFAVQNLLYHDVGATTLSVTDLSPIGDFLPENCDPTNLNTYCAEKGYTPFSDVSDYVGLENMTDSDLAQAILRLLADSSYTEALNLLRQHNTRLIAQRRLIPYYIATDSIAIAQNLLNQISATKEEDIRFIELNQLLLNLRTNGRTIFSINADEEQQLLSIANSGTKTGYKAQAILFAARGTDFPVVLPALANGGQEWFTSFKSGREQVGNVYPNPAQNSLSFTHHLKTSETGTLQLFTILGKQMGEYTFTGEGTQHLDISHLQNGLYFCVFSVNGSVIRSSKLSVIK